MKTQPVRKFTILDMMILIAASAAGLALKRTCGRKFYSLGPPTDWAGIYDWSLQGVWCSWYVLIAWCPALLVLRILPPRPRLRKVLRQPGIVACCAMIPASLVGATIYALLATKVGAERARDKGFLTAAYFMSYEDAGLIAFSIVGAWLTLALAERWHPRRDWIDLAGRIVGVAWIAGYAVVQICPVMALLLRS